MLKFDKVSFFYENEALFKDFCIEISENEVTGVLGHSGCGKTTLMELSSGMLKPFSGNITPFSASRPSFVFQEDRLLPQKTALENITFVGASPKRAREYLAKVGLEGCEGKLPEELSGGMSRRLSIARALAFGGDCFFIDEPLRGLDIKTSGEVLSLLKSEISGKTALIITHSLEEAFALCDRIIIARGAPFTVAADLKKSDFESLEAFKTAAKKFI